MKKILSYFFIFLGLFVIYISTSKTAMKDISDKRNNNNGTFGTFHACCDLVEMSYLDQVSKFKKRLPETYQRPTDTTDKNIDLYLFGDSYVVFIPDSAYAHVAHFYSGRRDYTKLYYKLDHSKRNIFVFENCERFARLWLKYSFVFGAVMRDTTGDDTTKAHAVIPWLRSGPAYDEAALLDFPLDDLFNPNINQNLEYNMFNYNFINPVREFKAMLNYRIFNRASGDVVISDDGNNLFLKQTLDEHDYRSSYEKLDSGIFDTMISNIVNIYNHYKKEGFDEVYYSIPPNPVSILQPKFYNQLLPILMKKLDSAGVPYIDDYHQFVNYPNKSDLYLAGDTHWSPIGQGIWIRLMNEMLTRESQKAKSSK